MVSALQLLLLLISLSGSCCHGARADAHAAAGDDHELNFLVVATSSLKLNVQDAVCSGHKVMPSTSNRTAWVVMNRPHGPCSSSSSSTAAAVDVDDMLLWDQLRTRYIRTQLSDSGSIGAGVPIIARSTTVSNRDYMPESTGGVGGGVGGNSMTSKSIQKSDQTLAGELHAMVSQTVVVDTSSDIPWVQCLPCPVPQCHPQKDPFYDPAKSSTFAPIPCGSPACNELGKSYGNGCSAGTNQCKYIVNYGDGRATAGTYVTDTLTLSPTIVVKNFRFGCSHAVRGSFSDQTAGVLALGSGGGSLLTQTAKAYGNAFSYCIPQPSSSGFLSLGGPAEASSKFARTPLIKNKHAPTFYIVHLQAITVAGKRLGVPPAAFAAGTVMDSGAVITQLPPTAYAALRAAFRSAMAAYGPLVAPVRNLDTCYDFTRFPEVKVPKVSLVFAGGATVELDAASVMLDGCLAFAATPGDESVGFIGNVQQQTYEVLYDVGAGSVGFRRGAC